MQLSGSLTDRRANSRRTVVPSQLKRSFLDLGLALKCASGRLLGPVMSTYEVRLFKSDGTLSIIMEISAIGDVDAKMQAIDMLDEGITRAEIWRDLEMVGTVTIPQPVRP